MKKLSRNFLLIFVAIAVFFSLATAAFAIDTKSESSKSYLKGDIDQSDDIKISDVVLLRFHIVNGDMLTATQTLLADLNNDGTIDILDVTILRSHIVGNTTITEKVYVPTSTTSNTTPSTSSIVTGEPISDVPVSVTLEAENADFANDCNVYNDKAASKNKYVEAKNNTTISFDLPENAYSGSYDVVVIARFTDGDSTSSLYIGENVVDGIDGDSKEWNAYYFSNLIISDSDSIRIFSGYGSIDVDCILLYSRYIKVTTPTNTIPSGDNSNNSQNSNNSDNSQNSDNSGNSDPNTSSDTSSSSSSSSSSKITTSATTTTDLSIVDGMYVSGNTLYDSYGNPFVMRGINVAHCWWSNYTGTSLQAASDLGANSVRIVLSDGAKYTKTSAAALESMLILCKKFKLIAVVEVHDYTGNNNASDITACANYWIEMKDILNNYQKYCIVNIANEWMGSWNQGSTWTNAYSSGVKSMRNAGIKNVIMIDAPGWGQDASTMINNCQSVKSADSTGNIMFSIHMYGTAGGNSSTIRNHIDGALSKGVCLCIGEFGYTHSDGDVDEQFIMQYCNTKSVGYLGWSWKGNGSGVEYLDMANTWNGSSLSDWGNNIFFSTYGISKTAKRASNFQ